MLSRSTPSYLDRQCGRKEAARLRAEEIDREDRVLCQKLGMPHGTDRFAACANVLSQARQNEARRVANDTVGIL